MARTERSAEFDVLDAVRTVSSERGAAPARIALAWLMSRPGVAASIIGATAERHLDEAIAALSTELGEHEVAALERPYLPRLAVAYA
jgi:aryl-alcohol dehydrogenase-like predicted oxidoreductase